MPATNAPNPRSQVTVHRVSEALLAEAATILGTSTPTRTVNEALRAVIRAAADAAEINEHAQNGQEDNLRREQRRMGLL
ncbi:type II toxin-antitoxin system VapB family antitoxin [Streptomyces sp. NPDC056454]|uniref:type II toxin-antitoxin system VapB family antitoxin n=1 Tax=Streptomyces sp. NPDC056454 TaxID=3345823 RepID=UPI00368839E4